MSKLQPFENKFGVIEDHYWNEPIDDLFRRLKSSAEGLTSSDAAERLSTQGKNTLETKKKASALGLFLNQFKSSIVLILLAATIISGFVGDWTDAVIILAIVLCSAILSFFQEYNASNAAEQLKKQISMKARVLRDGKEVTLPAEEVVRGDVVLLSAGSLIPADGILLEGKDFFVNQAVLTGETFPVEKIPGRTAENAALVDRTNCVFMGTSVRSGSGSVLIVETGVKTSFGQISKKLSLRPAETEFERGIRKLGYLLTEAMFILVFAIFAVNVFFHKPILDALLFSIALAVGLTPQLLPAIININLSRGSQVMASKGVIVRRLAAIENFGSMDILCTDKTGTLTEGVVKLDSAVDPSGVASEEVMHAAWLNAHFESGMINVLDEAIRGAAQFDVCEEHKVDEVPYDFIRKRLGIVINQCQLDSFSAETGLILISKGAFENVVEVCTRIKENGQVRDLDDQERAILHKRFAEWSEKGFRVLGIAAAAVEKKERYEREDETHMTFLGFLLFFDPPKPGVKETIAKLENLGVSLKIITGDNHLVADHVARTIGLLKPKILTGEMIDKMRDEALWQAAEKTNIFAEVDPNEKERIILALKKTGHVVGYMGDGINDAPSLHSADVGISVDNAVDVAKEAADFVLLKNDLDVLHEGILQGRRTFANTLKYVYMATSANFGNMFSVAGASLFLPFLPMLPKQILLINFMTDLPEMAIAGDQVDEVFIQKPHRWDVNFIRRFMLVFGTLSSLFDYATFALLLWGLKASETAFHTGWFIESILSASVVVFAIRTRLPFTKSRPGRLMMVLTAAVGAITLLIPYSPLASIFGFAPLPVGTLALILLIVCAYFISAEIAKRAFYCQMRNQV